MVEACAPGVYAIGCPGLVILCTRVKYVGVLQDSCLQEVLQLTAWFTECRQRALWAGSHKQAQSVYGQVSCCYLFQQNDSRGAGVTALALDGLAHSRSADSGEIYRTEEDLQLRRAAVAADSRVCGKAGSQPDVGIQPD